MLACIMGRCFGFFSTSILRSPTAMAPDETMMTRCPSLWSLTAVSTMRVRTESNGSWDFSCTMELLPIQDGVVSNFPCVSQTLRTQLDDYG